MTNPIQNKEEKLIEEKPPVLSTWNQLYLIVFINTVILILLFYLITKMFS
jgi:hypothetical protein